MQVVATALSSLANIAAVMRRLANLSLPIAGLVLAAGCGEVVR